MLLLVVSDFHLGKGQFVKSGQLNILEDFTQDERFEEFIEYYTSGADYWTNIHLVLNGDILNLIQVDVDGVFSHFVDEELTVKALDKVVSGHKKFFEALRSFLSKPNKKITYIVGNHDAGMAFEGAQNRFKEIVGQGVEFAFEIDICGIRIEHGHRLEAVNVVLGEDNFMLGPSGKKILNLPWGSLFCISLFPRLKKDRPHIDKVRPLNTYIKWCLFHDPFFFIRLAFLVVKYFIVTKFASYTKVNRNFKTTIKLLKQVSIYPRYGKHARKILKKNPKLHTVILGHSHILEWRKFTGGKYYFNTGTWNSIPSIDAGLHENITKLSYVSAQIHPKTEVIKEVSLKVWQGKWRPFRDVVSL